MPNPDTTNFTFYKAYCFSSLSPTFNQWARLTAADVHALGALLEYEAQQTYFYLNHPIKWIRLVGVVVDFEAYPNRFIMVLDDSSGANIEITCGRTAPIKQEDNMKAATTHVPVKEQARMIGNTASGNEVDLTGVDIGSVVKVKGGIGCFRGEKQMTLERLTFIRSTNEEAEAWAQYAAFKRDILSKPWIVSEQDERMAKRKAEGHEARQKVRDELRRKRRLVKEGEERRIRKTEKTEHGDGKARSRRTAVQGLRYEGRKHRPEADQPRRKDT